MTVALAMLEPNSLAMMDTPCGLSPSPRYSIVKLSCAPARSKLCARHPWVMAGAVTDRVRGVCHLRTPYPRFASRITQDSGGSSPAGSLQCRRMAPDGLAGPGRAHRHCRSSDRFTSLEHGRAARDVGGVTGKALQPAFAGEADRAEILVAGAVADAGFARHVVAIRTAGTDRTVADPGGRSHTPFAAAQRAPERRREIAALPLARFRGRSGIATGTKRSEASTSQQKQMAERSASVQGRSRLGVGRVA